MNDEPTQPVNGITAVRTALFDTLRSLGDKEQPMDIDRAKAINEVAQTIINSAKVEIDALRVIGGSGTGFIPAFPPQKPEPRSALENLRDKGILQKKYDTSPKITNPAPGVTRHTLD